MFILFLLLMHFVYIYFLFVLVGLVLHTYLNRFKHVYYMYIGKVFCIYFCLCVSILVFYNISFYSIKFISIFLFTIDVKIGLVCLCCFVFLDLNSYHKVLLTSLFCYFLALEYYFLYFIDFNLYLIFIRSLFISGSKYKWQVLVSCSMFELIDDRSLFITLESVRAPVYPILGNKPDFWGYLEVTEANPYTAINHGYRDMSGGILYFIIYYIMAVCMLFTFIANSLLPIVAVNVFISKIIFCPRCYMSILVGFFFILWVLLCYSYAWDYYW